jgi:hypothetical protein
VGVSVELGHQIERAIEAVVAGIMNTRHPDLPALWWTAGARGAGSADHRRRISGHPPIGVCDEDPPGAVRAWASALHLPEPAGASPDLFEFVGEVEGVVVRVWCWR